MPIRDAVMHLPDAMPQPGTKPTARPDLPSLAWALLRIGAVAFGGLGATLALLNRDLVERRGWLRSSDLPWPAYRKIDFLRAVRLYQHRKRAVREIGGNRILRITGDGAC
jgi:hypothetical protein